MSSRAGKIAERTVLWAVGVIVCALAVVGAVSGALMLMGELQLRDGVPTAQASPAASDNWEEKNHGLTEQNTIRMGAVVEETQQQGIIDALANGGGTYASGGQFDPVITWVAVNNDRIEIGLAPGAESDHSYEVMNWAISTLRNSDAVISDKVRTVATVSSDGHIINEDER